VQPEPFVPVKESEPEVENEEVPEPQQVQVVAVDDSDIALDMSMDSIIGSPMSVDRSVVQRRINYQQAEEEFYNVTEYQTEIYKYMKTAEVRKLKSVRVISFIYIASLCLLVEVQTKAWLHAKATGHHLLDAVHFSGLAG
jgi:hypothetical protein